MMANGGTTTHAQIRPDWLARHQEAALEPNLPIIDAHIHLYDRGDGAYLLPQIQADMTGGHNIQASVYVQARAMYRATGPETMRVVGESEFANGIAAQSASGLYGQIRQCSAIIPFADLRLGGAVGPVLDAHLRVSDRICGIRHPLAWDADPRLINPAYQPQKDTMSSPQFRAGFAELAARGMSFDAWVFFHQLPELLELAKAFPHVQIVINHCGGVLGIGPYQGKTAEVYRFWLSAIKSFADLPNVYMKLGGLGMKMVGFDLDSHTSPVSSQHLATLWRPYIHEAITAFGAERCMFETNFPVDKGVMGYTTCWNAFKRLCAHASDTEKHALFSQTAARVYHIDRQLI